MVFLNNVCPSNPYIDSGGDRKATGAPFLLFKFLNHFDYTNTDSFYSHLRIIMFDNLLYNTHFVFKLILK
jgi:hypothetical protein